MITSNNLLWIMNTFSRKPLQLFSNFCQLWATSLPVYHGKLSLLWHSSITDNNHLECKSENLVFSKRSYECLGFELSILQSSSLPQISNLTNIDNFKISAKNAFWLQLIPKVNLWHTKTLWSKKVQSQTLQEIKT